MVHFDAGMLAQTSDVKRRNNYYYYYIRRNSSFDSNEGEVFRFARVLSCLPRLKTLTSCSPTKVSTMKAAKDAIGTSGMEPDPFMFAM